MMDETTSGGPPVPPEPDEPIAELADLEMTVTAGFMARVRRAIDRRIFTSQVLSLVWSVPAAIFMEFLQMIFQLVASKRKGGNQ